MAAQPPRVTVAATLIGLALLAAGCGGGGAPAGSPPTAPAPATETVTVTYRDGVTGGPVDGRVSYVDASGRAASAATGETITILEGSRLTIEAAGYSRKETDARGQVDGAYWAIPATLQAAINRARGDGALQRPALDAQFTVVLDRLTFSAAQIASVRAALEAAAPIVTAGRYRWTFAVADDPGPRQGSYAVILAGALTFEPFLAGDEIQGGKIGINPTDPGLPATARLAAARMVGFKAAVYESDPAVYRTLTRLPIGNRAPNLDP